MIRKFEEDKIKEFELIDSYLTEIEKEFFINKDIRILYLDQFQYIINHIDSSCRNEIKRLKKINSELIQHIKGFTLLIRNQDNKEIKEEMIQSFIEQVKQSTLRLKEISL